MPCAMVHVSLSHDHDLEHHDHDPWFFVFSITIMICGLLIVLADGAFSLVFVSSTMVLGQYNKAVGFLFLCLSSWFLSSYYIGISGEVYYFVKYLYMLCLH